MCQFLILHHWSGDSRFPDHQHVDRTAQLLPGATPVLLSYWGPRDSTAGSPDPPQPHWPTRQQTQVPEHEVGGCVCRNRILTFSDTVYPSASVTVVVFVALFLLMCSSISDISALKLKVDKCSRQDNLFMKKVSIGHKKCTFVLHIYLSYSPFPPFSYSTVSSCTVTSTLAVRNRTVVGNTTRLFLLCWVFWVWNWQTRRWWWTWSASHWRCRYWCELNVQQWFPNVLCSLSYIPTKQRLLLNVARPTLGTGNHCRTDSFVMPGCMDVYICWKQTKDIMLDGEIKML